MADLRYRGVALFALFTLLVCVRMPDILLQDRLWAEEGIFFQNAWTMPPWRAATVSYGGYLNLAANLAAVLARWTLPLQDAPIVTTGVGLLFQLCPALLIVTSRAAWLRPPLAMAAALIALAAAPLADEVWLQTLHSQYHLTLCAALILVSDDEPGPALRSFRRVLLFLAPLCGLLAVLLLPLFLLRSAVDRSRERVWQTGLLLAGAAIQLGLFYAPAGGAALGRSSHVWPLMIAYVTALRHVVLPFAGLGWTIDAGQAVRAGIGAGAPPVWPLLAAGAFFGGVAALCLARLRSAAPWLLAASLGLAAVSAWGAIDGGPNLLDPRFGERYSFVPQVLLTWTLIALASHSRLAGFVAAWWIVTGLVLLPTAGATPFAHGPAWRDEVRRWRADPGHAIALWPEGWTMRLHPDHSPAPVAGRGT